MAKATYTEDLEDDLILMFRVVDQIQDYYGCWLWKGATTQGKHPIISVDRERYQLKGCTTVRRLVVLLSGKSVRKRQPISCRCGNSLCVNPNHLYKNTISKVAIAASKSSPARERIRQSKIAKTARKLSKLSEADVQAIRSSSFSASVEAAKYKVSKSTITRIRRGEAWKDYANVWVNLFA